MQRLEPSYIHVHHQEAEKQNAVKTPRAPRQRTRARARSARFTLLAGAAARREDVFDAVGDALSTMAK